MGKFVEKKVATKAVNYTEEQTATVKEMFANSVAIEEIAKAVGKTPKSVIGKLVREGVYHKAEKVAATNTNSSTKAELAKAIGAVLQLEDVDVASLVSASKKALNAVFSALANSKPISD